MMLAYFIFLSFQVSKYIGKVDVAINFSDPQDHSFKIGPDDFDVAFWVHRNFDDTQTNDILSRYVNVTGFNFYYKEETVNGTQKVVQPYF
jgi:hypothetical protein